MLISEMPIEKETGEPRRARDRCPEAVGRPPDKSHIFVHTHPEAHPHNGIASFRADIDVSTCGKISAARPQLPHPLLRRRPRHQPRLPRARGFHPRRRGHQALHRPLDHLDPELRLQREILHDSLRGGDVNNGQEKLFHTKMMRKEIDLDHYVFGGNRQSALIPSKGEREKVRGRLPRRRDQRDLHPAQHGGGGWSAEGPARAPSHPAARLAPVHSPRRRAAAAGGDPAPTWPGSRKEAVIQRLGARQRDQGRVPPPMGCPHWALGCTVCGDALRTPISLRAPTLGGDQDAFADPVVSAT